MFAVFVQVNKCLSIKGAEDTINKPNAFEISTHTESMFFIADTDKVRSCCSASPLQCMLACCITRSCTHPRTWR